MRLRIRLEKPRPGEQALRRDGCIRILDNPDELVVADASIEPDAQPAAVADVGRDEVGHGIRVDQERLDRVGGRTPERGASPW